MDGKCDIKVGLFVKRQCNKEAKHKCISCNIEICSAHSKQVENGFICPACFNEDYSYEGHDVVEYNDSAFMLYAWYSIHRDSMYHHYHYSPFDEGDYGDFEVMDTFDYDDSISDDSFFDS